MNTKGELELVEETFLDVIFLDYFICILFLSRNAGKRQNVAVIAQFCLISQNFAKEATFVFLN